MQISHTNPRNDGRPSKFRHVPALDGIRGLAILLVLFHHLMWSNDKTGSGILNFFTALRGAAWVGVDLFFVLSGFLITGILFDSLGSSGYFKNFYARRFLRIFPLYYGVLFVLLALTRPLHLVWHGMQYVLFLYLQNTGLWIPFEHYTPATFINLNHLWSLAVEEQFYLVWPFLIFWIKDLRKLVFTTIVLSILSLLLRVVLLTQGANTWFVSCFTACRADSLLIGGCLALLMRTDYRDHVLRFALPVLAVTSAILIGAGVRNHTFNGSRGFFLPTVGFTLIAVASASLIAETFRERSLSRRFLVNPVMRFFGKYSYGIYVLHYIADASLTHILRPAFLSVTHSKAISVVGGAVVVTVVTLIAAMLSYHFYELPFLKLKKYFEYGNKELLVKNEIASAASL